ATAARRLPDRRIVDRVPGEPVRAAGPDPGGTAGTRRQRRGDRQPDFRCGRRAVPGLGWVWLVQGSARSVVSRPGGRGSRGGGLRIRPGRHAHRDASGRLPRRGHFRSRRAGVRRAGVAAIAGHATGFRSLPGGGSDGRSTPVTVVATPARPHTQFVRPAGSDASEPPEARGIARDGVKLLVARPDGINHARFADLGDYLSPGDLLLVNNSATLPAAVDGRRAGRSVAIHFSTERAEKLWVVELRPPGDATGHLTDIRPGERIEMPGG